MTAYTKSTNFATKDTLTSGDPLKIVKGTEINTEFDNIATAVNSKSDTASPTFTGTVTAAALTTTGNTILGDASTDTLNVGNGGLVKDANGNVGIGVTPQTWNGFNPAIQVGATAAFTGSTGYTFVASNWYSNSGDKYITTAAASRYYQNGGAHYWNTAASGTAGTAISFTTPMTLDSSGNLLVTTTSQINPGSGTQAGINLNAIGQIVGSVNSDTNYFRRTGTDGNLMVFYKVNSAVGGISVTASATAYATSSDYRLKENIAPMTGGLAKVSALKPVIYTWKSNQSDGQGFIAHELAEVVPQCVIGEKDAVDSDGNPVYQGIDTSFLVATLTAAIQEQQALITALTARITALENK